MTLQYPNLSLGEFPIEGVFKISFCVSTVLWLFVRVLALFYMYDLGQSGQRRHSVTTSALCASFCLGAAPS
jgi:hypothetical protein